MLGTGKGDGQEFEKIKQQLDTSFQKEANQTFCKKNLKACSLKDSPESITCVYALSSAAYLNLNIFFLKHCK